MKIFLYTAGSGMDESLEEHVAVAETRDEADQLVVAQFPSDSSIKSTEDRLMIFGTQMRNFEVEEKPIERGLLY